MEAIPGLKNETWGTRRTSLSSRPLRLRSGQAGVEGSAFSVLSFASGLLLTVFMLAAVSAHATTYTVTDLTDNASDTGSIRYAVNNAANRDTIDFSGAGASGTITLTNGALLIKQSVTIVGPGANLLTISGNNQCPVFLLNGGLTVSLSGLTIANGNSSIGGSGFGGGIANGSGTTLTVSNSTFSGNSAGSSGEGGGIANTGTLTVSNSTFSGNSASSGQGGAIANGSASATLTVSNSTFSGNTASGGQGGAIYSGGTLTVSNSTFSGNSASSGGGILNYNSGATVTITNSVVAGNTDTASGQAGNDCSGCGTQSSNNLISTSSSSPSPNLGPLQYNGGPTETMMPLPNSPALNAGLSSTLATDQRGFPRPTGTGVVSDLGAVQLGPLTVTTTADSTDSSAVCGGSDVCSLRDAITLANSQGSGDISFAFNVTGTITLSSALPALAASITITGPGANLLTISGNKQYPVFNINSASTVSLSGLTIADGGGSGVVNSGTLTVSNSAFSGNTASGNGYGGGGGIYNNGGTVVVSDSTFSGNTASGNGFGGGGGIYNFFGGTLTVSNSTFSGNMVSYGGGGIFNGGGTLTVSNSTFAGNSAGDGGGIANSGGSVTITNSIVAGNTDTASGQAGEDCDSCGTQSASNLISTSAAPIMAAQLNLGPLAYNGPNQTVQTLLPLPGSPAIEAGNPALVPVDMTTDERGLHRIITINGNATLDLGAVQTNYTAVQFMQQPADTAINAVMTPPVTLSVTESGAAAVNIPVPLTLTGNGTLAGTLTETTTAPVGVAVATASYGNLSVNAAGTGDTLDVSLPITATGIKPALTLTATSSPFDVFQITPTITWSPTPPTSVVYGAAPITLNATSSVTGPTISYVVDTGPGVISGNTLSFTGAGTVVIEAVSAASNGYASGSVVAYITVVPAATTTTLASSTTSATAGSSVTLTATVKAGGAAVTSGLVLFSSGTTSMGAEPLNSSGVATLTTTNLPVGSDAITASFVASGNDAASTSNMVSVAVSAVVPTPPAATTTTLASSTTSATAGSSVTLTATVKSGSAAVTSGLVLFSSGTTSIGAEPLTSSGVATLSTTNLPVGSDTITASFVASGNDAASTSASVTVTVSALTTPPTPSYTLTATPASLSITPGQTGSSSLTITPSGGYSGKLTLVCAGLPANASCTFTQSGTTNNIVTLSGNNTAVNVTLNIQTNVATARLDALPAIRPTPSSPFGQQSPLSPILPALAFWWPGSMAGLAAFGRKKNLSKTRQRMVQLCLLVLMTGALAAGISGCGGSAASTPAAASVTPAGTSNVIVTAAPESGTVQATTITLTIS